MLVFLSFDCENETYDIMDKDGECLAYGDIDDCSKWLNERHFHSDNCLEWENDE